jgi:hydroxyacylglutathione hydrolase
MKIKEFSGLCSCYLIDGKEKVLIDAGADVKDKVDIVILTHAHFDHTAFLDKIVKRNKCKVYASATDAPDIEKVTRKVAAEMSPIPIKPVKVDRKLKKGEVLEFKDFKLKVIETPGHTNGSISLYNEDTQELFSGDTLFFHGGTGRTDFPTGSAKELHASLKKLSKLKIKTLYPGHNY